MGAITLPNFRTTADVRMDTKLKDGGVYIEWSSLTDIKAWIWSDAQKALAGRVDVSVDNGDATVLKCLYASTKPQYPGVNRLIVQVRYNGSLKTYDKPVFNFVPRTAEATGAITISDPEVTVEIEVTDMSSSILDNAIAAALAAAAHAEHAASLVPLQVLQDCVEATQDALAAAGRAPYIGENGHWWVWSPADETYVDTGNEAQGPTGNGIASWAVVESQEDAGDNVVTVTFTDGTTETFTYKNGHTGNGIASIVQTVESPDDAGTNVITITMTNGTVVTFNVKNGSKGQPGTAQAAYKSVETLPTASAATMDKIYLTPSGTSGVYNMSYTDYDGSSYSWVSLGTTAIQLSDYATKAEVSQLEADVDELGNRIGYVFGDASLSPGAYASSNGYVYHEASLDSTFSFLKVGVKEGSVFHIETNCPGFRGAYIITKNDGEIISQVSSIGAFNGDVTIPENGAWLYINCINTSLTSFKFFFVPERCVENTNHLNTLEADTIIYDASTSFIKDGYYANNPISHSDNASYKCLFIEVKNGDKIRLRTQVINQYVKPWYLTDANNNVITSGVISADTDWIFDGTISVTDATAKYLYINSASAAAKLSKLYVANAERTLVKLHDELSERIDGIDGIVGYFTGDDSSWWSHTIMKKALTRVGYWGGSVGSTITFNTLATARCTERNAVKKGDKIEVCACYNQYVATWIITDASGKILSRVFKQSNTTNPIVSVFEVTDDAAAFIYFNCSDTFEKYFYALKSSLPVGRLIDVDTSVRKCFPKKCYPNLLFQKCPAFYNKVKKMHKDICVVITGTSLSQGNKYASLRSDASIRPPLMMGYDFADAIYDRLINYFPGQQNRRYDHSDLSYVGDWSVVNNLSIWDDGNEIKNPLTKTSTSSSASVAIVVPDDAWQFNFIYKTDSEGGNCSLSIAEGNGKMEVWNGSAWVEANGYTFSMLEPAATATKGNTCYQKRLKMRCKNKATDGINSIGEEKTLTITKAADSSRMNVVGFEWSPREFMFTLINAARGGRQWGVDNQYNLEKFQDSDIWEFSPDLILAEVTIINWNGGFIQGVPVDPLYYVNCAKRAYFNEFGDDPNSIYEKSNHWTDCDVIFYGDTANAGNAGGFNEDGSVMFGVVTEAAQNGASVDPVNVGRVKTIFDNYLEVDAYMATKGYIYIPAIMEFKKVAEEYYGSYRAGFAASLSDGKTLSVDNTHLNDNGAALWAAIITPLFEL